MIGMIQPLVRRIASSTKPISASPKTLSSGLGEVLRSVMSSPPISK